MRRVIRHVVTISVIITALGGVERMAAQAPQFEVVSIKPSDPKPASPIQGMPQLAVPGGGRFTAKNLTLVMLVNSAYNLPEDHIVGWPEWKSSQKFDINGKADVQVLGSVRDLAPLLQSMLTERFALRTHTESRELPVSVLTLARSDGKLGADLHPSTSDCTAAQEEQKKAVEAAAKGGQEAMAAIAAIMMPKPGEVRKCAMTPGGTPTEAIFHGDGLPMLALSVLIQRATNMTVVDETGLNGLFDWDLRVDSASLSATPMPVPPLGQAPAISDAPPLIAALREQLGLKVTTEKRPVSVLVIDSVSLPTPD